MKFVMAITMLCILLLLVPVAIAACTALYNVSKILLSLYKRYNITFDRDRIESVSRVNAAEEVDNIETLQTESTCDSDIVAARQRTLMWNVDMCLQIAPGQNKVPLSITGASLLQLMHLFCT